MEVLDIIDEATRWPATNPLQRAEHENRIVDLTAHCVLVGTDGREYRIEDSAAPIHDQDCELNGAVIVFRDVNRLRDMTQLAQHGALTDLSNRLLTIV